MTISNVVLSRALEKANHKSQEIREGIAGNRKRLYFDLALKVIGMILCLTVYPPAMMISVLLTMFLMIISTRRRV